MVRIPVKKQTDAEQFVLPFKNLFNDSYCRDISTKVRSQLAIKRKNGQYVGNFACYGYLKDPADHNHLVIDQDAAPVIQQIFFWKINGLSAARIADRLNSLGVLCPMEYKKSLGMKVNTQFRTNDKAKWAAQTIQRILHNEVYIGNMTQGRRTTPSYKVKKMIEKPEEEWDRVENTHEAIIHKDIFDVVQMLLLRDTRISPEAEHLYLFGGYLCCADCGSNMVRRRQKHNDTVYSYYYCSGYKRKSGCTSHIISEHLLYDAVLNAIQQQCLQVLYLYKLLKYAQDLPDNPDGMRHYDVQLAQLDDEIQRSQNMKIKLVENLNAGIITREDYRELSPVYDQRIKEARKAKQNVEAEKAGLKAANVDGDFISTYKKYQNIESLDRTVLAALVEFIEVHEDKRLTIHFKYTDEIERIQSYLASKASNGEIDFSQDIFKNDPEETPSETGQVKISDLSNKGNVNPAADTSKTVQKGVG